MVSLLGRRQSGNGNYIYHYAGLSYDEKPQTTTNGSIFFTLDTRERFFYSEEGGVWLSENQIGSLSSLRVESLDATQLCDSAKIIEAVGIPAYVDDLSEYAHYGITEKGWYVFARIKAPKGKKVTGETHVVGANAVLTEGESYVDIAVRFDVAATTQLVTIFWDKASETYAFRATDLAVRNLDYRVTFYVYDAEPYVTWEYALTTDTTIQADKKYYTKDENDVYTLSGVSPYTYQLTADATFAAGKTYYTYDGETYTAATVTEGEAVTENTYYEQTTVPVNAYYVHEYALTADTTFTEGKTYYTESEGTYTAAEVTAGGEVTADTYYEDKYTRALDAAFADGVTYYTLVGGAYTPAEVTAGDPIPLYYNHSKCIISGLVRNITYKLDEIIDCPMEFILPQIEDETHGCWFEIRCRHAGEYSMTLTPPSSDVKIATEHTQKETAGINMINLHYTVIDGLKIWRFMNTHSSIPTT